MRYVILFAVLVLGCTNPIERAQEIEEDRRDILTSGDDCKEIREAWTEYQQSVFEEDAYHKMFKYILENTDRVHSSSNRSLADDFCDFRLAREEVSNALQELLEKGCGIDRFEGTGYSGTQFNNSVNISLGRLVGGGPFGASDPECAKKAKEFWAARRK